MKRTLRAALLLTTLLTLAVGCDEVSEPDQGAGGVVIRGNGGEPGSLDPALAEDIHAFNVLTDLYEGLVAESATGQLLPGAAESWIVSEDKLTYLFTLRHDARWSNGDPVTAHDFVRAFQRIANPATGSAYGFLLDPVSHFSEIRAGLLPVNQLGVTAVSERDLQIRLAELSPQFLSVLAMPVALPVHVAADNQSAFSAADEFVGNGAYVLESRTAGGPIRLRRSVTYWDAESVAVDQIVYLPIVNPATEYNMYRAGELDITHSVPPERFEDLHDSIPGHLRIAPSLALYYVAFDTTEAPLNNPLLRQALAMAIDRERLVSLIGRGEQPAFGIVPPGIGGHVPTEFEWTSLSTEDRERLAKALYQEAGYSDDTPLEVTYTYDTGDIHEKIALAVTAMWRDLLGVEAALEKKEWQYFLDTREQRSEWQIMRFAWFGDYNHPSTFTNLFRSGDPQNLSGYANPEYDRLLASASAAPDPQRRSLLMNQAEMTLLQDHPIAPLYFYVSKHLVRPGVGGFEPNALDRHPSKYLFLEQKP